MRRLRSAVAVMAAAVMMGLGFAPGAGRAHAEVLVYCDRTPPAFYTPPSTAVPTSATTGWGYMYVDNCEQTSGLQYTNPAMGLLQGNSAGFANKVNHYAKGYYQLVFPGLAAPGGVVHVSAYGGGDPDQCLVTYWGPSGYDEHVLISCYDINGAPTDRRFMASFTSVTTNPGYDFGYLWADQPASTSYTPSAAYQYTTAGAAHPNLITRTGVGQYQVTMTGITSASEDVMVSAYGLTGSGPARCRVTDSSGQIAHVACFAGAAPIDSTFSLTYVSQGNLLGAYNPTDYPSWNHVPSAYAWVVGNGGSSPLATWRFSTAGPYTWGQSYDASNGTTTVMLPTGSDGGDVQVVAYGTGTAACDPVWVSHWKGGYQNSAIVQCWNSAGQVVPGEFNLFFSGQPWS